jgi:hypothetical protein
MLQNEAGKLHKETKESAREVKDVVEDATR